MGPGTAGARRLREQLHKRPCSVFRSFQAEREGTAQCPPVSPSLLFVQWEPGVLRRAPANSQDSQAGPASLSSQNHTVLISLSESQLSEGPGSPVLPLARRQGQLRGKTAL